MNREERIKLFHDVFAPKTGEKILFLVDIPRDNIKDTKKWRDRREMAREWYITFKELGQKNRFSVRWVEYPATGLHNTPLHKNIRDLASKNNLVIAITEFSATSSLVKIAYAKNSITRCASMPGVERRMEKSAFKADYSKVKRYADAIKKFLEAAIGAEVTFSTGDKLYVDLRYRNAKSEAGECTKVGQFINLPSGEGWKAPYEATSEEIGKFGESKTEGIIPFIYNGELVKHVVKNNRMVEVIGKGKNAEARRNFLAENDSRRNIAEFAIGCNPQAVVTGNILEDEKSSGLHIGYAMSNQLGGKVESDMHDDLVFTEGCPVEATTVTLINKDGSKTNLIKDSKLRYDLLK